MRKPIKTVTKKPIMIVPMIQRLSRSDWELELLRRPEASEEEDESSPEIRAERREAR